MKIIANEFVIPIKDGWESHASHFVVLEDGRIFCVFFYGSKEGKDDVRIYGCFRDLDGHWSEPIALTEDDGYAHWNPVLFQRKDGSVMLFYKVGKTIPEWITKCKISYDNCQTWGDSFELVQGDTSGGRGPVRNKAIYLSDNSILSGASTEFGDWICFFDRSFDDGKTWQRSQDVCLTREELAKHDATRKKGKIKREGIIQPTLWESSEGVHALMRSTEGIIYRTDSVDGNEWCIPYPIDVPNNNSGIDACVLPDGRIVLACNPVSDWDYRTPMSLYISNDNGQTFKLLTHLTTGDGKYSYPAIRYENGKLHVTYTWNRKTIQYFCLTDI